MENEYTLNNSKFEPIYIFFKFGPLDRLEQLHKTGYIYMKNLKYFVDLEKQTLIKGKGDKFEARMFQASNLKIYDYETNNLLITCTDTTITDKDELYKPVFCITAKNILENITEFNYPHFESNLFFDHRMIEDFCKNTIEPYVLVITNVNEFLKRITTKIQEQNLNLRYNLVTYQDTTIFHQCKHKIEYNNSFNKDEMFSYQSEFRFIIDEKVDDYYDFSIGSIEDISIILPAKSIIDGLLVNGNTGVPYKLDN